MVRCKNSEIMELKIGDAIFGDSRYSGLSKLTLKRETNTQLVLENQQKREVKIRKPFKDGCTEIGTSGYANTHYYLENEKMSERYQRQINDKKISCFPFSKLNNKQIQDLVDFIDTFKETV